MAKRVVTISDTSGKDIPDGEVVSVVVDSYPGLSESVRIDMGEQEVNQLKLNAKEYVLLQLGMPDGSNEQLALDADVFKKGFRGDADEVLSTAERAYQAPASSVPQTPRTRRPRGTGAAASSTKVDYTSVEHAGAVKRGIVSEGEKQTVQQNFDEVNRNLEASGQRQIDLSDISHVEKYGLQELAKERGITPVAK